MRQIIENLLLTGLVPLAMLLLGWLVGKYLTPWVHAKPTRLERAKEISMIADRITDELVVAFPSATWDNILDKAVDRIIDELEIPPKIAKREAIHQLKIKGRIV